MHSLPPLASSCADCQPQCSSLCTWTMPACRQPCSCPPAAGARWRSSSQTAGRCPSLGWALRLSQVGGEGGGGIQRDSSTGALMAVIITILWICHHGHLTTAPACRLHWHRSSQWMCRLRAVHLHLHQRWTLLTQLDVSLARSADVQHMECSMEPWLVADAVTAIRGWLHICEPSAPACSCLQAPATTGWTSGPLTAPSPLHGCGCWTPWTRAASGCPSAGEGRHRQGGITEQHLAVAPACVCPDWHPNWLSLPPPHPHPSPPTPHLHPTPHHHPCLPPTPPLRGCVAKDTLDWAFDDLDGQQDLPSLAFIHIPLPQFMYAWLQGPANGSKTEYVGCPSGGGPGAAALPH
jgi:hypothetical protein